MRFGSAIVLALIGGLSCGSDAAFPTPPELPSEPAPPPPQPPPVSRPGHPAGVIAATIPFIEPNVTAAAVSNNGLVYVTQIHTGLVYTVNLTNRRVDMFRADRRYNDLRGIVLNGAGDRIFIAASHQDGNPLNDVLRLDARRELIETYRTSGYANAPISVLLSRDETTLYVGTGNGLVNAFDIETGLPRFDIDVGSVVVALAHHPTRDIVYASGLDGVVEIDTPAGEFRELDIARSCAVGIYTQAIALSPDGRELYVAYRCGVRPSVLVWDTQLQTVTDSVPLPAAALGLVATPDGAHIYVGSEILHPGEVWVIDRVARTLIKTIPVGGVVKYLAISPDGHTVVAPNSSGWVDIIR